MKRLADRLLMPGLVNAHMHSGLLRGTAEGLPVWEWLQEFIDPMHRVLTPAEAETASYLCYAESLLAGTTSVVDMWRYMYGSAKAAAELGIRARGWCRMSPSTPTTTTSTSWTTMKR